MIMKHVLMVSCGIKDRDFTSMLGLANMSETWDLGLGTACTLVLEATCGAGLGFAYYDLMSVSSHAFATNQSAESHFRLRGGRFRFTKPALPWGCAVKKLTLPSLLLIHFN